MWGDELVDPVLKAKHNAPGAYWTENTRYREQQCFLGLLGLLGKLPNQSLQTLMYQDSKSLACEHGHPNEKGHQVIRDLLIPEIDRAIITV